MSMTENRFREIVNAYGTDETRWPQSEQQNARDYKADNPRLAAKICSSQLSVDAALNSAVIADTDDALLRARILKQAQSLPQDGLPANDSAPATRGNMGPLPWKSLAATLIISAGMGFGMTQAAASASGITQAEALLTANSEVQYSYDWLEETP